MKCIHNSLIWILLSIIVVTVGMCSEIERAHSFPVSKNQSVEADAIDGVKNSTVYIGNCTHKLMSGLRDTIQRIRKGQGEISFRGYAEFLWMKEILHILLFFCSSAVDLCLMIQSDSVAILEYIHNQDGEK